MRWLLPFFLLAPAGGSSGARAPPGFRLGDHRRSGWRSPTLGPRRRRPGPGRRRAAGSGGPSPERSTTSFPPVGSFVLLIALAALGLVVGFGIPLRQLLHPAVGHGSLGRLDRGRGAAADHRPAGTPPADRPSAGGRRSPRTGAPGPCVPAGRSRPLRRPARPASGARTTSRLDPGRDPEPAPDLVDVRAGARHGQPRATSVAPRPGPLAIRTT